MQRLLNEPNYLNCLLAQLPIDVRMNYLDEFGLVVQQLGLSWTKPTSRNVPVGLLNQLNDDPDGHLVLLKLIRLVHNE